MKTCFLYCLQTCFTCFITGFTLAVTCVRTGFTVRVLTSVPRQHTVWTSGRVASVERPRREWRRRTCTVCVNSPMTRASKFQNSDSLPFVHLLKFLKTLRILGKPRSSWKLLEFSETLGIRGNPWNSWILFSYWKLVGFRLTSGKLLESLNNRTKLLKSLCFPFHVLVFCKNYC